MQNNKFWFFGSKLNTALLLVLIIVMSFAIKIMLHDREIYFPQIVTQNTENNVPTITKEQAESVALPILKACWGTDNIKIVSATSSVMDLPRQNESSVLVWRVGGNYSQKDFPLYINDRYGYVPEVFIDAKTGKLAGYHFQEITDDKLSEECSNLINTSQ